MNPKTRLFNNPDLGLRQRKILRNMGLTTIQDLAEVVGNEQRLNLLLSSIDVASGPNRTAFVQSVRAFFPSSQKSAQTYAMGCLFNENPQSRSAPNVIGKQCRLNQALNHQGVPNLL